MKSLLVAFSVLAMIMTTCAIPSASAVGQCIGVSQTDPAGTLDCTGVYIDPNGLVCPGHWDGHRCNHIPAE